MTDLEHRHNRYLRDLAQIDEHRQALDHHTNWIRAIAHGVDSVIAARNLDRTARQMELAAESIRNTADWLRREDERKRAADARVRALIDGEAA